MSTLKDAFKKQDLPIKTFQKNINQRPPNASKMLKKAGKKFVGKKVGKLPKDVRERYEEPELPLRASLPSGGK